MEQKDFLQSEFETTPLPQDALFHVIPVPLEKSVSYGSGTGRGPEAILEASQQLEVFDGVSTPLYDVGIYTDRAIDCNREIETVLKDVGDSVRRAFDFGKIPVLLGGEHTVTLGALEELKRQVGEFGIIQFDAHADLRDEYEGTKYSHACVMRRAIDLGIPVYQIGVRCLSSEEEQVRKERGIVHLDAREIYLEGKRFEILEGFPEKVYVTIDVDGLDPSVIAATGTPAPGGILWYDMIRYLQNIVEIREVIGFDCVELAPADGDHRSDFAAAQLVYNFMGMIARK